MDPEELVARARDLYVEQFVAFAAGQKRAAPTGVAEVKLKLGPASVVYQHFYCVDFVRQQDGKPKIIELQPERALTFAPIVSTAAETELRFDALRWNDVVLRHDLSRLPGDAIAAWFQRWFDPDDERHVADAETGNVIHSLVLAAGRANIDFGTAEAEAFWNLLEVLISAGAARIRIGDSTPA
ncbi:MAG TPA: hypothetical protein VGL58_15950 [Caulobacteraceae bacterium]|jgi:hypothetical protein